METKKITEAIISVMKEVNNIWKNTTVWTGGSSYKAVSDSDVKKSIRESMIKNWLSIVQTWVEWTSKVDRWEEIDNWSKENPKPMKTKQSCFTEVVTKYLLLHTSWESIELSWYGQGVDTQDKWAGKATTYALKNTLINTFLVPTWEDTDNTHSDDLPVPQRKQTQKNRLNYENFMEIVEAWNTTEQQIANIIRKDWYDLSQYAKNAVRHYVETGEIDKNLFYKQAK